MITRNFKLCLNAGTALAPNINVNQYDHGEQWVFTLYNEDGTIYTPSTGAIIGIKADGRAIANAGSVVDGKVVINETEQMTAAAGRAIYELLIDDDTHGTANFVVNVERRPADDADFSGSDLSLIQQAVDSAATIEDLLDGHDPDEVIADAVDAWLDAHPEATTTVEDGAITEAKLNDSVKTGVFEDMTVGTSLSVWNDEGTTDNLAYKFRQTGGDAVRELDEIVGGTIAWNQLVNTGATSVTVQSGHKYLSKVNNVQTIGASTGSAISINDASADNVFDLTQMFGSTVADAIYAMEQSSAGSGVAYFRSLFPNAYYAYNSGELVSVEGLSAHETTGFNQWDEEYESGAVNGTSGRTYNDSSKIRSKNYIPVLPSRNYYIKAPAIVNIAWYDSNKVFITGTNSASVNYARTSPSNAMYFKFSCNVSTYNNDICINISDPAKNGTYKPYQKHTYPLDSTLTLRGVPKWSNGLNFDGDIYRHDGSVTRRYGVVTITGNELNSVSTASTGVKYATFSLSSYGKDNLNSLSNNYQPISSAPTAGGYIRTIESYGYIYDNSFTDLPTAKSLLNANPVTLVYELETPTTEQAEPYQQYQICDGKGTEEYISTTVTPVGHNTFYPVDIVAKVNKLPSDFSTLIAPTEEGFKATRNYVAKNFLIVNNQLYRVTANIANGANIVPNTNVTAVTIADILTTLI